MMLQDIWRNKRYFAPAGRSEHFDGREAAWCKSAVRVARVLASLRKEARELQESKRLTSFRACTAVRQTCAEAGLFKQVGFSGH